MPMRVILQLTEEDFAWATVRLMEVADMTASGRVVSVLEGGYDLQALAGSVGVHVHSLMHGSDALPESEEDDDYDEGED
jgi:acetoin utilization deacetylase AcuC-like enzyme